MEIETSKLYQHIYPEVIGSPTDDTNLDIVCNVCGLSFYRGEDFNCVDIDWIGALITHLLTEHPEAVL